MTSRPILRQYIKSELNAYTDLLKQQPGANVVTARLKTWIARTRKAWATLDQKGIAIPDEFLAPYKIEKKSFFPDDVSTGRRRLLTSMVQLKYQLRGYNMLREYSRCVEFFPEITDPDTSYDILELSSGSCASFEVAKYFGNNLQTTEFLGGRGSVYEPIHKALGLDVVSFDGSQLPYSFADQSYDIVLCYQAIDAYGDIENYHDFISEMLRVARKKVVIVFNPGLHDGDRLSSEDFQAWLNKFLQANFPEAKPGTCPSTTLPAIVIETPAA